MAVTLTSGQRAALEAADLVVRHGAKLELDGGTVAFWDDFGDFTYDSQTYEGIGGLGTIKPVVQTGDLVASGVELELAGLDQAAASAGSGAIYAELDSEPFHGRAVTLYRFYFEPDSAQRASGTLVLAAQLSKSFIDRVRRFERAGPDGTGISVLRLFCESRAMEYGRLFTTYRSNEHQQSVFSGDDGFEFTPVIGKREILWGRSAGPLGGGGDARRGNDGNFRQIV